jgi:hypothetical protein
MHTNLLALPGLDLLRALHERPSVEPAAACAPEAPPLIDAICEDCKRWRPCLLFTIGPTAPDGGDEVMAICPSCREAHLDEIGREAHEEEMGR